MARYASGAQFLIARTWSILSVDEAATECSSREDLPGVKPNITAIHDGQDGIDNHSFSIDVGSTPSDSKCPKSIRRLEIYEVEKQRRRLKKYRERNRSVKRSSYIIDTVGG
ncbi:hypothetical protein KIN20_010556 [Parelaphostrongylus tenuis]|uniref:Uncharacterized protein n=1 Tax=Parelaphostrongylus tenuis TaxID=148309 RepID=A0AAD5MCP8_PARTN|nr:hypothetical protein KIN20_010556 [Parelaphostrongylus tenuis]